MVGGLLRFITAAVRATQREELRLVDGLDLTLTQFTVMHLLDSAEGELSMSELAHQLELSAAATSRAVDTLGKTGIVARRDGLARLASGLIPAQRDARSAALQPLLADVPAPPGAVLEGAGR